MMERAIKTYRARIGLKVAGEQGEFAAVFATMNVIDHDQDVTLPGAFGEQRVLIEPWNHNYLQPPVGKGAISEADNEALVNGKFFLSTVAGQEHYTVVKELEDLQEWSYSFYIEEAEPGVFNGQPVRFLKKLDVIGVGPVSRGAGIATHTTDIKCQNCTRNHSPVSEQDQAGNSASRNPSRDVYSTRITIAELDI
jgi:hypothetical protein